MESIEFKSSKGKVRIANPFGGSGNYQIYINDYYQGELFFRGNKWISNLNDKSELTDREIQIIGAVIDERFLSNGD